MCPMFDDAEEMDLSHIQKYQNLRDNMDSANKWDKWCNLSKLYWTAREKWEMSL
jgi:hypothetical protein